MHCTTELYNVLERGLRVKGKTIANILLNSGLDSTCLDFEFDGFLTQELLARSM
jgi:hypothetical protein